MADEIIEELWAVKDAIAKEADYDVDKLIAILRTRQKQRTESNNKELSNQRATRGSSQG